MVVDLADPEAAVVKFFDDRIPQACDFCARPLVDPAVVWHFGRTSIFIHGRCALALGHHLIRDGARAS